MKQSPTLAFLRSRAAIHGVQKSYNISKISITRAMIVSSDSESNGKFIESHFSVTLHGQNRSLLLSYASVRPAALSQSLCFTKDQKSPLLITSPRFTTSSFTFTPVSSRRDNSTPIFINSPAVISTPTSLIRQRAQARSIQQEALTLGLSHSANSLP
ncbi:hypothetical protein PM082_009626 [Marasmius tenuissimus]|nr:hypothetical protein PM082_009626 [Marasmius tenuissimus]